MRLQRRFLTALLALLLLCALGVTAYARELPDLAQKGSVSVTMRYDGAPVPGGTLTLYRVGAVQQEDWNFRFVLTGDFLGCGLELTDIASPDLADKFSVYAVQNRLEGTTKEIDQGGQVTFEGLEPGLYLLAQHQPADGFESAAPFLVSVPLLENGEYLYDVDASPKVGLRRRGDPPADEPEDGPHPTPDSRTPPSGGDGLPQTGQLNWPVPVLAALGLLLFALGWRLRFGRKGADDEK